MTVPSVRDVMTADVVTVAPDTDFKTMAQLMRSHRVNQLPVVDAEHRVVGLVSEADLLAKVDWTGRKRPSAVGRWFLEEDLEKASGSVASEVMTAQVAGIHEDVPINEAARQMRAWRRKSLPVVDDGGRLVGIVSRSDLLKEYTRPDRDIQRQIAQDVLGGAMAIDPAEVQVRVRNGNVILKGHVESRSLRDIIEALVAMVPGVVGVDCKIGYGVDDSRLVSTVEPADYLGYTGPRLH